MSDSAPDRGDVWLAALDPVAPGEPPGEQGGTRPVLVLSTSAFNGWPVGLVLVVPITSRQRGFSHHVPIVGGSLDRPSFAMPEYVRSIVARRLRRRLGAAEPASVAAVADWLRRIAGLCAASPCDRGSLPGMARGCRMDEGRHPKLARG